MKFQTASLRSKVAQRIFLLFIACALVPIGGRNILAFYQVSSQLRDQSRQQLEEAAKSHGMSTYQRLEVLDDELQLIALRVGQSPATGLVGHFQSLGLVRGRSNTTLLGPPIPPPVSTDEQLRHLSLGKPLL